MIDLEQLITDYANHSRHSGSTRVIMRQALAKALDAQQVPYERTTPRGTDGKEIAPDAMEACPDMEAYAAWVHAHCEPNRREPWE